MGQPPELPGLLAEAAFRLAEAGVASPRADAELLAAYVSGVPRTRLATVDTLTHAQHARFAELVSHRARRVPLQHLVGTAAFGRIEVVVGAGGFVPRPETELLAEWGVQALRGLAGPLVVVDLCAGVGAIGLLVAQAWPDAEVVAVEAAARALVWLRRNAGERLRVVAGDATDPGVLAEMDGTADLVLANPPYVPLGTPLPPEVADHDPPEAVFGGPDGLDVIRPLIARAANLLRPGGRFGVEHDDTHGTAVPDLLAADGRFEEIADNRDLAGRPRYTTARRR